jgi:hypothetical protein
LVQSLIKKKQDQTKVWSPQKSFSREKTERNAHSVREREREKIRLGLGFGAFESPSVVDRQTGIARTDKGRERDDRIRVRV